MKYIYHCHAIHNPSTGRIYHIDGLVTRGAPVADSDGYQSIKEAISEQFGHPPDNVVISSLTLLHAQEDDDSVEDDGPQPIEKEETNEPELVYLGRGIGETHADEARLLGLRVGDTIRGREGGIDWWHEVRLTLVWLGERVAVYRKRWRSNVFPDGWKDDGETANLSLSCREFYLEKPQD